MSKLDLKKVFRLESIPEIVLRNCALLLAPVFPISINHFFIFAFSNFGNAPVYFLSLRMLVNLLGLYYRDIGILLLLKYERF